MVLDFGGILRSMLNSGKGDENFLMYFRLLEQVKQNHCLNSLLALNYV